MHQAKRTASVVFTFVVLLLLSMPNHVSAQAVDVYQAEHHWRAALSKGSADKDIAVLAFLAGRAAGAYGDIVLAEEAFASALEASEASNSMALTAASASELANLLRIKGKRRDAIALADRIDQQMLQLKLPIEPGVRRAWAYLLLSSAKAHMDMTSLKKAEIQAKRALSIAPLESDSASVRAGSYDILSASLAQRGQVEQALKLAETAARELVALQGVKAEYLTNAHFRLAQYHFKANPKAKSFDNIPADLLQDLLYRDAPDRTRYQASIVKRPAISISPTARINRQQGVIIIELDLNRDGSVQASRLIRSNTSKLVNKAVLKGVKAWHFTPAAMDEPDIRAGLRVAYYYFVTIRNTNTQPLRRIP